MKTAPQPTQLEFQVLSLLWKLGPMNVHDIRELIPDGKERAYTTILSVLQSLTHKQLVTPQKGGRQYLYAPSKMAGEIRATFVRNFVQNFFLGSVGDAATAILSSGSLTPDEKTALGRELTAHKAMPKKTAKKTATGATTKVAKKAVKKAAPKKAAKKAAPKKAAAKKAVAKKAVAKKTVAKKTVAKKAAVKKVAAKKVAAKKVATKKAAPKKAAKKSAKK